MRFGIPAKNIHLVPNAVDGRQFYPATAEERAAARRALGLGCERLVLYVGRLSAEKNPVGLLEAWAAMDAKVRETALLALVGDGPDWNQVQAKAHALNVASSVHMAGQRSDVGMWYRAADVYAIPSRFEGLSNTMVEALAFGLPVISTRVSGSSVLVGSMSAGLLVDIGNDKQLAGAMESVLGNEAMRRRLSENARLTFEARFSLETVASQMILLYRALRDCARKQGRV